MIKHFYILFFLVSFSLTTIAQESNIVKGEVLLMLEKSAEINDLVSALYNQYPKANVKVKKSIAKSINVWLLSFNEQEISEKAFLNILYKYKTVQIAQFNHTNIALRDTCPDDTHFALKQWSLNNTGQTGGVIGSDIEACKAWDLKVADSIPDTTFYGDEIVVAVIDDGFDLNHPDLNYYLNTNEIPNDSIDNDGNGFVDDVMGWNFYANTGTITQAYHGTHVSGVIGAKGNNNKGISGIAPGVKILPIQGSSDIESDVLEAYGYVLEMRDRYDNTNGAEGAFIVATNSSFGVDYGSPASFPLWCAFYDSLGVRGILSCAATANSNINVDMDGDIPTTCTSDYLITVNNTTASDSKYPSGYGVINIDLGAPGTAIYSTTTSGNYGLSTGTSQATPHVAGTIAFIYSVACSNFMQTYDTNPASTALLVKDAILGKVTPNPNLAGITVSGGRLNMYEAAYEIKNYGLCSVTDLVEEKKDNAQLLIFPNPNNGNFSLKYSGLSGEYDIIIYNSIGEVISTKKTFLNTNNSEELLLNNKVDKGLYFLCLKSHNSPTKIIKFIVE